MNVELSILITSYKNARLLDLCLGSIKKNVGGISYEVIVANSETDEETFDLMREKYPSIIFIPNSRNIGFGKLVNQALKVAKGRFVFVINSDIIIKNDAVKTLLLFLRENKEVGMVGPQLINFDNSIQNSCFRFYSPITVLFRRTFLGSFSFTKGHLENFLMRKERDGSKKPFEADWVMGSAMMMKKAAIEKVGLMDERFFMYFEDVDWCWRFWEDGYKVIYHPGAKVFHYHGKKSASKNIFVSVLLNKYARIHIASGIKFFLKHLGKKNPHSKKSQKR